MDRSQSRGYFELIKQVILEWPAERHELPPQAGFGSVVWLQYVIVCDQITAQLWVLQRYGLRTG